VGTGLYCLRQLSWSRPVRLIEENPRPKKFKKKEKGAGGDGALY